MYILYVSMHCILLPDEGLQQCFSNFFPWRTPYNNRSYPEEPLPMQTKQTNTMIQLLAHGDYFNISNCRTKIYCDISRYVYNFFAVFQNNYIFIPLFLSEPLTMFSGNLRFRGTRSKKHWPPERAETCSTP